MERTGRSCMPHSETWPALKAVAWRANDDFNFKQERDIHQAKYDKVISL